MKIKQECEAAILKYLLKSYRLEGHTILSEDDSEDVRFNFEVTLAAMKNENNLLCNNPNDLVQANPKDVSTECEMSVNATLLLMGYDNMINTKGKLQNGSLALPYFAITKRHTMNKWLVSAFDAVLYVRSIFKQDDLSYFIAFALKKRGETFFSKKMREKLLSKWKPRQFLQPFWDQAILWLRK